ncbi:MAG TPA: hypothetical protein LFW11_03435 [Rickettsia endosymbiont of Proechinophthirus fluctus]|uniref:hypothetical protein n=1 Tax=Rickettsia endosymbiont of Proechinophthirus fluctus TaxID=1462733 RepID=UPI0007A7C355|nr:hypothetical protein [Rickettsia endosymbiont of Proechinophthirus fluctus]KYP97989.1 hypothetical protein BG75_02815 [Rickettsia endosymbiont of Proechinophthirus fluctus]HJD54399.1 hypothetical protein [Rickettsia endosymbiont of Proechinophthirus fluctus]
MKDFETADSAEKVYDLIIKNASTRASIFIDVDDTLITPKSKTFKQPPYNQIIDRIKEMTIMRKLSVIGVCSEK